MLPQCGRWLLMKGWAASSLWEPSLQTIISFPCLFVNSFLRFCFIASVKSHTMNFHRSDVSNCSEPQACYIICLQCHCLLLRHIVPNAGAQSKHNSFQAEQCELHWVSVLERLSPAATFWISNTTTPVRAWWSLSEAETKPWARLEQTHGTEKHIGEVWCLLSHLKNTSSCTRLVEIGINSRTGRGRRVRQRAAQLRGYFHFSILSFPM